MKITTATQPTFEKAGSTGLQGYRVCMPVSAEEIQRMPPSTMATGFRGDRTGEKAFA